MQPSEKITGRVVHRGTHRYRSDRPMLEVNSGHRGLESLPASTLSLCSLCHQRRILKGGGVQGVDRGRDRWPEGIGGLLENVNRALENNRGQQRYTTAVPRSTIGNGTQSWRDPYRRIGYALSAAIILRGMVLRGTKPDDSLDREKYGYWRDERSAGDQRGNLYRNLWIVSLFRVDKER